MPPIREQRCLICIVSKMFEAVKTIGFTDVHRAIVVVQTNESQNTRLYVSSRPVTLPAV